MHAAKECRSCLEGLGERMSRVAADDDATQHHAQRAARSLVKRKFRRGRTVPPRLATLMFREVVRLAANPDPFHAEKSLEYESGIAAAKRLLPLFPDNLQGRLHLAVAGNRVDFFRDLAEVEAEWRGGIAPPVIDVRLPTFGDAMSVGSWMSRVDR